jgi:hypothetical protein
MAFKVTTTFGHLNRKGPSAWEAALAAYGQQAFDALDHQQQIDAVRSYVNRG